MTDKKITVKQETWETLTRMKLDTHAKNLDEVIQALIKRSTPIRT